MKKTSKTKRGKGRQSLVETSQVQEQPPAEVGIVEPKIGPIRITLEQYQNVAGFFQISSIRAEYSFLGKKVGETGWIPVTDDEYLYIDEFFTLDVDINSVKDLNKLISSPVIVTVYQVMDPFDPNLEDQLQNSMYVPTKDDDIPRDSIVSVYEPITDQTLEFAEKPAQKEKSPKKKKSKSPKKSKKKGGPSEPSSPKTSKNKSSKGKSSSKAKSSKGKSRKTKSSKSKSPSSTSATTSSSGTELRKKILEFGMCTVDLLPLFHGRKMFSETIFIKPTRKYKDDQMKVYEVNPKIVVTVSVDEDINTIGSTIMNCTVESIYNIPSLMKPEMQYLMCGVIPVDETENGFMLFTNPKYKTTVNVESSILWPGIQTIGVDANTTKYRMSTDYGSILCKLEDNIIPHLSQENPRLEFNMIKRNFLLRDGMNNLAAHIKTHRYLVLEFYMTTKASKKSQARKSPRKSKKGSSKGASSLSTHSSSEKSHETFKKSKQQPFLHLMTFLDCSSLLYPGVSHVRLASPLTTFSKEEALKVGNLKDSYFSPSEERITHKAPAKKKKGGKKDKAPKKKKSAGSSKSSKKESVKESPKRDPVEEVLPEPEPEPSLPVYDENGKPCFVIVEIALSKPIVPKYDVEDLEERVNNMIQVGRRTSMQITYIKEDPYKNLINDIIQDINKKFPRFLGGNLTRKVTTYQTTGEFVKFLQFTGTFQDYLTAMSEVAIPLVQNKIEYDMYTEKDTKQHQNFISEEYDNLVSDMNETINQLVSHGMEPSCESSSSNNYLFFSKEAMEMKDSALAERYLLERISSDTSNPNHLFDYAVYSLENKDSTQAYEYVKQALFVDPTHRHSLLMYGILLDSRNLKQEAEDCLLNLTTVQAPRWVEGWTVLYMFYKKYKNQAGMDVTLGMAKKYEDDKRTSVEFFTYSEDLAWTYRICPRTIFFRTAIILLKMRLFDWAEVALSEEATTNSGLVNYLLSAIEYYKGDYCEALKCVEKTKADYGLNYAIAALSGHCLFALGRMAEAKQEYYRALGYINRPDSIHMVYLNCANILETFGEYREAKKLLLLANKYTPTPTTWLRVGILYFKEKDLLAAEECFSEGNLIDYRRGELWGNLCLVNLKLNRPHEAELCYQQAINNKLEDNKLQKEIEEEFEKLKVDNIRRSERFK